MVVSNTSDHIQIKIKMQNPSQEPPASSKVPNEDLMDMDVLCTFIIYIENQNFEQGCSKEHCNIKIKIKVQNLSLEPPASSKVPNQYFKDMDVLCTFKIKIESKKNGTWVYQRPMTLSQSRSRCLTQVRTLQHSPKPQIRMLRT